MKPNPSKAAYYTLEGLNSFATAYFFNYLLQRLKREAAWSDFEILALCVVHGVLYVPFSWYGGRFGQRHGYFASLRVGFGGSFACPLPACLESWFRPALMQPYHEQCVAVGNWLFIKVTF
ncbi:MAG: hypothetical protein ACKO3N_11325, partial [Verrucomicrobiota bacterium]